MRSILFEGGLTVATPPPVRLAISDRGAFLVPVLHYTISDMGYGICRAAFTLLPPSTS
jgi:hypothetical protein